VVLDCLLSRLQQHGNIVPAWIVVIAHWTTVSLSTARNCPGVSAGVSACYTVQASSRHVLDKAYKDDCQSDRRVVF